MVINITKGKISFVCLVILILATVSCASYTQETAKIREAYKYNQLDVALQKIDESSIKSQNRNKLLYLLERAMILDRMGQRDESRKLLLEADRLADQLYTTSISKEALTLIYNDSAQDYPGEDYEKVAIHIILALSFIQDGDLNSALIEARKINNKVHEINTSYGGSKNHYSEDAFGRYLSGVIHETKGNIDDAIIDYNLAYRAYKNLYTKSYGVAVPEELVITMYKLLKKRNRTDRINSLCQEETTFCAKAETAYKNSKGKGELVIFHEQGLIARKITADFMLPLSGPGGQVTRFSFPIIEGKGRLMPRHYLPNVHVNGTPHPSSLYQSMDAIAYKALDDKRLRLMVKQAARLVAKGQATKAAEEQFGELGGLAANIYSLITETADTRSWTTLPSSFSVTRISLNPGKYKVKINSGARLSDIVTVDIKAGQIQMLRDYLN